MYTFTKTEGSEGNVVYMQGYI